MLFSGCSLTPAEVNSWLQASPLDAMVLRVYWLGSSPAAAASHEQLVQQLLAAAPPAGGVRLQCWPRALEVPLSEQLQFHYSMQPVGPSWALHIVQLSQPSPLHGTAQQQGQGGGQRAQQDGGEVQAAQQTAAALPVQHAAGTGPLRLLAAAHQAHP